MAEGNGKLYLDAKAILAAPRVYSEVKVPEWGGSGLVRVRGLTTREVLDLLAPKTGAERIALAVALGTVDANGAPIFAESDVSALLELDSAPVLRVNNAISALTNGMDIAAEVAAAKKNFETSHSGDRPSN